MTKTDYTHLCLVVDRSGSMMSIRDDAEGGVNSLIAEQSVLPGDCTLAVYQFDDVHDKVFGPEDIANAPKYHLNPRGSTAMLDAIGRAILDTDIYVDAMAPDDRPEKVIFVVSTDGQENASVKFTHEMVRQMITERKDTYGWEVIFLGANQDAAMAGAKIGTNSTTQYVGTGASTRAVYSTTSASIGAFRGAAGGQSLNLASSVADDGTIDWGPVGPPAGWEDTQTADAQSAPKAPKAKAVPRPKTTTKRTRP